MSLSCIDMEFQRSDADDRGRSSSPRVPALELSQAQMLPQQDAPDSPLSPSRKAAAARRSELRALARQPSAVHKSPNSVGQTSVSDESASPSQLPMRSRGTVSPACTSQADLEALRADVDELKCRLAEVERDRYQERLSWRLTEELGLRPWSETGVRRVVEEFERRQTEAHLNLLDQRPLSGKRASTSQRDGADDDQDLSQATVASPDQQREARRRSNDADVVGERICWQPDRESDACALGQEYRQEANRSRAREQHDAHNIQEPCLAQLIHMQQRELNELEQQCDYRHSEQRQELVELEHQWRHAHQAIRHEWSHFQHFCEQEQPEQHELRHSASGILRGEYPEPVDPEQTQATGHAIGIACQQLQSEMQERGGQAQDFHHRQEQECERHRHDLDVLSKRLEFVECQEVRLTAIESQLDAVTQCHKWEFREHTEELTVIQTSLKTVEAGQEGLSNSILLLSAPHESEALDDAHTRSFQGFSLRGQKYSHKGEYAGDSPAMSPDILERLRRVEDVEQALQQMHDTLISLHERYNADTPRCSEAERHLLHSLDTRLREHDEVSAEMRYSLSELSLSLMATGAVAQSNGLGATAEDCRAGIERLRHLLAQAEMRQDDASEMLELRITQVMAQLHTLQLDVQLLAIHTQHDTPRDFKGDWQLKLPQSQQVPPKLVEPDLDIEHLVQTSWLSVEPHMKADMHAHALHLEVACEAHVAEQFAECEELRAELCASISDFRNSWSHVETSTVGVNIDIVAQPSAGAAVADLNVLGSSVSEQTFADLRTVVRDVEFKQGRSAEWLEQRLAAAFAELGELEFWNQAQQEKLEGHVERCEGFVEAVEEVLGSVARRDVLEPSRLLARSRRSRSRSSHSGIDSGASSISDLRRTSSAGDDATP